MTIYLDSLVGPTHHFGGHSFGNLASTRNMGLQPYPREAALQGLIKMKKVCRLGGVQYVFPPQPRPDWSLLSDFGYPGLVTDVLLQRVQAENPDLLCACFSSAFMWMANAATVSEAGGVFHITPANLRSQYHRCIETRYHQSQLQSFFRGSCFVHHPPLQSFLSDEGAANLLFFSLRNAAVKKVVTVFVYGKQFQVVPKTQFPPRQSLESGEVISRRHQMDPDTVLFVQQSTEAIDAGVFHNDVIAMGIGRLFIVHEKAYVNQNEFLERLQERTQSCLGVPLELHVVSESELSLKEAVATYFFNSQLIQNQDDSVALLLPGGCRHHSGVQSVLTRIRSQSQFLSVIDYVDLDESLKNGGGPACLRLACDLSEALQRTLSKRLLLTESKYEELRSFVERYYPKELCLSDFSSKSFLEGISQVYRKLSALF